MSHEHAISVWFFIGGLLAVYGALILGSGIYDFLVPQNTGVAMQSLHLQVWWGLLLLVLGVFYVVRFRPGQTGGGK
jgi:hypothetical protein